MVQGTSEPTPLKPRLLTQSMQDFTACLVSREKYLTV